MKTKAVNIYKEQYDVYGGRGKGNKNNPLNCEIGEYGWLGNPISIGKKCHVCKKIHNEGGETLPCYKKYLSKRLEEKDFIQEFLKLKGKTIGCFCKPKPCHLDIIVEVLNEFFSE